MRDVNGPAADNQQLFQGRWRLLGAREFVFWLRHWRLVYSQLSELIQGWKRALILSQTSSMDH